MSKKTYFLYASVALSIVIMVTFLFEWNVLPNDTVLRVIVYSCIYSVIFRVGGYLRKNNKN